MHVKKNLHVIIFLQKKHKIYFILLNKISHNVKWHMQVFFYAKDVYMQGMEFCKNSIAIIFNYLYNTICKREKQVMQ